jgi:hypothetical protein
MLRHAAPELLPSLCNDPGSGGSGLSTRLAGSDVLANYTSWSSFGNLVVADEVHPLGYIFGASNRFMVGLLSDFQDDPGGACHQSGSQIVTK